MTRVFYISESAMSLMFADIHVSKRPFIIEAMDLFHKRMDFSGVPTNWWIEIVSFSYVAKVGA